MPRIGHRIAVAATALITVAGCASMQSQVTSFSGDYSIAMEQFQNREIVTNILRARDRMPLHFAELSQINGSLQEQIQIGSTIPFGKYVGLAKKENDFSPQLQFQSSPTFTTSPLDTQAFAVGMLQPVDASYFANYWAQGRLPKKALFELFIDSVRNADGAPIPGDPGTLRNNPDATNDSSYQKFEAYLSELLRYDIEFQTMTVMTPLAEPFAFDTTAPAAGAPTPYKLTDILGLVDESTIHLGLKSGKYQLFRRWDDQLVLCYHITPLAATPLAADVQPFADLIDARIAAVPLVAGAGTVTHSFMAMTKGGNGKPAGNTNGAGQNAGGSPKAAGSPAAGVQIASPVLPLAAMLPDDQCAQLEFVATNLNHDETALASASAKDVQFRLKSVQDIFAYLGDMIRPRSDGTIDPENAKLFRLTASDKSQPYTGTSSLNVDYRDGKTYHVGTDADDHTSQILEILNELVNARKLSSDIATTKQVQVIP